MNHCELPTKLLCSKWTLNVSYYDKQTSLDELKYVILIVFCVILLSRIYHFYHIFNINVDY